MLTTCKEPGCATFVMGGRCLEHERRPTRVFVRGRPFVSQAVAVGSEYGLEPLASPLVVSSAEAPELTLELPHR